MENFKYLSMNVLRDIPWDKLMKNEPLFWFGVSIILTFLLFGLLGFIQYIYFRKQKPGIKYEEILTKRKGNKKLNLE
jgi:hypothetical protein